MITITRPDTEPPTLAKQRELKLEPLMGVWSTRQARPAKTKLKSGWASARAPLHRAQHKKCAYCEWRVPKEYQDVDHFWPKSRYWWLTWTWTNLVFSCHHCNRTHKRNRLPVLAHPVAGETPAAGDPRLQVLDPAAATIDPYRHIEYIRLAGRWQPVARAGSALGHETIALFGLDQPPVLDLYDPHVDETVAPSATTVAEFARAGNHAAAIALWERVLILGEPHVEFTCLNRDALNHFVPADLRVAAGLRWPW